MTSFSCLNQESQYVYFLKDIFYNPHISPTVSQDDQYKLNIFLDIFMKIIILLNLRLHKFYLFRDKKPTLPSAGSEYNRPANPITDDP